MLKGLLAFAAITFMSAGLTQASAEEPCPPEGDIDECKVLIEINASDGDIGFHFLGDADDLRSMRIDDPNGAKVFENRAFGPLAEQKLTENFGESAEPLCWPDPEADPEDVEDIETLREFRERWDPGTYEFRGKGEDGEMLFGETTLSYDLPAAPKMVDFDGATITWMAGNDLGHCAPLADEGFGIETVAEVLDIITDPALVPVAAYEVVMEPDVEDGDPIADEVFSVRVSGDAMPLAVDVPALYLGSLPADTLVKIEVGAIGFDDNATFTEEDGFCVNEDEGCEE
jgi:hypothetical protein